MIAASVVHEVRRLLAEGNLSQRKIAKRTGVSRGTVGAIAAGKRPDYESLRPARKEAFDEPDGPPQRCPVCGGMVSMPCRACSAQALKTRSSKPLIPQAFAQLDEPLGLDLTEEHRRRYEEVRARKMLAESEPGPADPPEVVEVDDDGRGLDPDVLWEAFELDDPEPVLDGRAGQDFDDGEDDDPWSPDAMSAWCR